VREGIGIVQKRTFDKQEFRNNLGGVRNRRKEKRDRLGDARLKEITVREEGEEKKRKK